MPLLDLRLRYHLAEHRGAVERVDQHRYQSCEFSSPSASNSVECTARPAS